MPNTSIKATPMDRYLASESHAVIPKSTEWLDLCFMNRVTRKVRNDSTITIQNTLLDVPKQFIRRKIEVRYLPDRLDEAYIYELGEKYYLKITNKVANAKTKREQYPTIDYSKEVSNGV